MSSSPTFPHLSGRHLCSPLIGCRLARRCVARLGLAPAAAPSRPRPATGCHHLMAQTRPALPREINNFNIDVQLHNNIHNIWRHLSINFLATGCLVRKDPVNDDLCRQVSQFQLKRPSLNVHYSSEGVGLLVQAKMHQIM